MSDVLILERPERRPPLADVLAELKREAAMRKNFYPKAVARGKLTEQAAQRQYQRLVSAIQYLTESANCVHCERIRHDAKQGEMANAD